LVARAVRVVDDIVASIGVLRMTRVANSSHEGQGQGSLRVSMERTTSKSPHAAQEYS
jgi:hypothetical protein